MVKLIILEGVDASGKSSQVKLIQQYYEKQGLKCKFIHFPMYGHNKYSDKISKFLRGEYGNHEEVSPWFVANIYALDRAMYLTELKDDMQNYDVIIMDRYVYSNIAYQCAKVQENNKEQELLRDWILDFEFNFISLPKPDLVLFLDVPMDEIDNRLNKERTGEDRKYLEGKKDVHEQNMWFQYDVRKMYYNLNEYIQNYHIIKTVDDKNKLYDIQDLFNSYKKLL